MKKKIPLIALATALLAGCGGGGGGDSSDAPALRVVAVTTDNRVVTFNTDDPANLISDQPITGLGAGQSIVGVDQRPLNGSVYGVSNTGVVYVMNVDTGAATAVGADGVVVDASASAWDIDFNPQVVRIRLGNTTGNNLRINPDTGAQVDSDADSSNGLQGDTAFSYADATSVEVVGLAYTNSVTGASSTTLYAIDRAQDQLARIDTPNNGRLTPIAPLGVNVTGPAPLDITPDNAYGVVAVGGGGRSRIVFVDVTTGETRSFGRTPSGTTISGLAIFTPIPIP